MSSGTGRCTPRSSTELTPRVSGVPVSSGGSRASARGSSIHTNRLLDLSGDLPVAVVIVDDATHVRAFLDEAADLLSDRPGHGRGRDGGRAARREPPRMTTVVWVALGAAFGAPLRYLVDRVIQTRHDTVFPWGTMTANVTGCLVLGFLVAAARPSAVGRRGRSGHGLLRGPHHLQHVLVRDAAAAGGRGSLLRRRVRLRQPRRRVRGRRPRLDPRVRAGGG